MCGENDELLCDECMSPPPKREKRRIATSPVSVVPQVLSSVQKQEVLAEASLTLLVVYSEIVKRGLWDVSFDRGWRAGVSNRRLATKHLHAAATDGWNVLAGSIALAQTFLPEEPEFTLSVRIRLAVCLNLSWKFQRSSYSCFPRRFASDKPSLVAPHTHELAKIGYFFMTKAEQDTFGGWHEENVAAIRDLFEEMQNYELDMIGRLNLFSLCTLNEQMKTEMLVDELFTRQLITDDCALAARSLVPFFTYCAAKPPSAHALVCAALLALSNPKNHAKIKHTEWIRVAFSHQDRADAWELVHSSVFPTNVASYTVSSTCFNDPAWHNYRFVDAWNLRSTLVASAAMAI